MLQVKLSNGSDGLPVGYPIECTETPDATLRAGFDVVMTAEQLEAEKHKHRVAYRKAADALEKAAKQAQEDAQDQAETDQLQYRLIFRLMNEVRALKGEPEMTRPEFRQLIRGMK